MAATEPSLLLAALDWILRPPGAVIAVAAGAGLWATFRVNKSRKTDAALDREQREAIADKDRDQRAKDAALDRADRKADRELHGAENRVTMQALTELLRRTQPLSPPGTDTSPGASEDRQAEQGQDQGSTGQPSPV